MSSPTVYKRRKYKVGKLKILRFGICSHPKKQEKKNTKKQFNFGHNSDFNDFDLPQQDTAGHELMHPAIRTGEELSSNTDHSTMNTAKNSESFILTPNWGRSRMYGIKGGLCLIQPSRTTACRLRCHPSMLLESNSDSDLLPNEPALEDNPYIIDIADDPTDGPLDEEVGLTDESRQTPRRKKERQRTSSLINEIMTQPKSDTLFSADAHLQPAIEDDETAKYIRTVVKAADTRKAEDIVALRVSKLTYVTSFIVIATGNNTPQLRAIANLVEDELVKVHQTEPLRIDGVPNSGWILLDCTLSLAFLLNSTSTSSSFLLTSCFPLFFLYIFLSDGDFLVNIFSPEQRSNYNLERLWRRAEVMDVSDCLVGRTEEPDVAVSDDSLDDWLGE